MYAVQRVEVEGSTRHKWVSSTFFVVKNNCPLLLFLTYLVASVKRCTYKARAFSNQLTTNVGEAKCTVKQFYMTLE